LGNVPMLCLAPTPVSVVCSGDVFEPRLNTSAGILLDHALVPELFDLR
jgi:hypothetical protein